MVEHHRRRTHEKQTGMTDKKLELKGAELMSRVDFRALTAREVREARAMDRRMKAVEDEIKTSGTIFVKKPKGNMLQNPRQ